MTSIENYDSLTTSEVIPELNTSGQSLTGGKKKIGRYEVMRVLGRGAFGTVKLALDPETQTYVAIKILKHRKAQNEREMEMIEREKKALMMLNHPNIVKLLEIIEDEEKQITYLVFEYVSGGELFSYIVYNGRLTESVARKFVRQIVSALEYCHFNLIVHRDLKPENLLLDDANNIKITDFGLANFITPQKFSTFCGSLHYAAPEILHGQSYGGPPVDVYALGIILYCLVNGKQPFDADTPYEMIKRITTGLHYEVEVSKELKDLIHKMLTSDPKKRISLNDIRNHAWILKDHNEPPVSYVPKFKPVPQIDESIMREVVALGFEDKISHRRAIMKNKNKQVVAAYQLCLSRRSTAPANTTESESHPPASDPAKKLRLSKTNPIPEQALRRSLSNEDSDLVSARSRKSLRESQNKLKKNTRDSKKEMNFDLKASNDNYDEQLDQIMNDVLKSSDEAQRVMRERSQTTGRQTPDRSYTPERSMTPERASKRRRSSVSATPTGSPKGMFETLANRLTRIIRETAGSESNSRRSSIESSLNEEISASSDPEQQRNIKLSSSFNCDTTSSKSTKEIKKKIVSAAQKSMLLCDKLSRYEFKLTLLNDDEDNPALEKIVFSIEIVKMKGFKNLKGLTFKRLEGDIWQYKNIATNFLTALNV